ncbi:DNA primase [Bacillus badius]|uniref:DNA primase n=1 Tax=Bacillus badius TaxID=1455 RepID=UPI0005ADDD27|nr:toprim domain-containing protein [Bacillus badius]KIL74657.1 DNA primase [Bacillus badius]
MNKKQYKELYQFVARMYHHILVNTEEGDKAYAYLTERGIAYEAIKKFQLGYSHKGDILLTLLKKKGYEPKELYEAGLLRIDKTGEYRDFFYGRIMFPIRNERGDILAFSGRVLPSNTHPAKYLNTPDTPFFEKGELLFNLDGAKEAIQATNCLLMFEGYLDTITAVANGIPNAVSAMGTALTDRQIEKIGSLTDRAIVCFDGDKAGMESAIRRSEQMSERGLKVRLSVLPEGVDPHDYINQHGAASFLTLVSQSVKHMSFCKEALQRACDLTVEKDRIHFATAILSELALSKESVREKRKLLNETASDVGVPMDFLKMIFKKGHLI